MNPNKIGEKMDRERLVMKIFDKSGREIAEIPITNPAAEEYNERIDLINKGKLQQAIISFKRAVEIEPRFIDAHYNLAVTYYALSRNEEARREYEIVLGFRPNDVDALNNLGVILYLKGEHGQAKQLFDKALAIDSEYALTHRNLAAYYKMKGDITKTAEHVRRAIEIDKQVFDREPGPPRLKSRLNF